MKEIDDDLKARLVGHLEMIEAELRSLGIWDQPETRLAGAFLGQLRHSMIPGIHARLRGEHPLPEESNLGLFAVQELEEEDAYGRLIDLLCEFDAIYNGDLA